MLLYLQETLIFKDSEITKVDWKLFFTIMLEELG